MISIIVPAYNAARYLPQTIESVLQQTISEWELILVDDGSQDETLTLAQQYAAQDARIRVLHQENAGVSAARNSGLAASTLSFPYVAFLDADDCYKPEALQTLRTLLEADPQAIGAHAVAEIINECGEVALNGHFENWCRQRLKSVGRRVRFSVPEEPTTFAHIITGCCIPTPGLVMLRRAKLDTDTLFNPQLSSVADWDLYIRLLRRGYFVFSDHTILSYRQYAGSMSSNAEEMRYSTRRLWRAVLNSSENTPEQREITRYCFRAGRWLEFSLRLRYAFEALRARNLANAFRQLAYGRKYLLDYMRGRP